MKKLFLTLVSVAALQAEPLVQFDTNTGVVVGYTQFANGPKFTNRADIVIVDLNTNLWTPRKLASLPTNFFAYPLYHWRYTNGVIVLRDINEVNAELSAAQSNATVQAELELRNRAKTSVTNISPLELRIRAADLVLLQRINRIGSSNGVPPMTVNQFRTAVLSVIDDKSAD